MAEALKALRPLTGQVTGTVTIGAFLTICRSTLIPALPDLVEALPGVDLRIEETEETPGMAALRTGHYDILVIERDEDPGLPPRGYTDIPFLDEPWVLVTPDSAPPIGSIEDLADLTWLRVNTGTSGDHVMRRITKAFPDTRWPQAPRASPPIWPSGSATTPPTRRPRTDTFAQASPRRSTGRGTAQRLTSMPETANSRGPLHA